VTAPGDALTAGIARLRAERGLSLSQVAAMLGTGRSTLWRAGSGEDGVPGPEQVAAAFGVTVAELLAPCPHCGGCPAAGYMCLRCRASSPLPDSPESTQDVQAGPS
jgi:transcriptional regulator with XRE-family HTH domain